LTPPPLDHNGVAAFMATEVSSTLLVMPSMVCLPYLPPSPILIICSPAISGLNDFDIDKSTTLDPLAVDKKFNLLDQEISCPPVSASLKIDVDAKANALATIGVAASGTIIPPKMDDFAIISSTLRSLFSTQEISTKLTISLGLTAEINGSLDLLGTVSVSLLPDLTIPILNMVCNRAHSIQEK
jgi:hypothetical protein